MSESAAPCSLLSLPIALLSRILRQLRRSELVRMRAVCRRLRDVCTSILNADILDLMDCDKEAGKEVHGAARRLLRCELRMLAAVCPPHLMRKGRACFTADAIIDGFHSVIRADGDGQSAEDAAVSLYFLDERFMDHFDDLMLEESSYFGSKVVDILDCCVVCSYELVVSKCGEQCRVAGAYQTGKLGAVEHPPKFTTANSGDSRTTHPTSEDLKNFLRYLRNTVRWNNLLDCLDKSDEQNKSKRKTITLRAANEGENNPIVQKVIQQQTSKPMGDPCFSVTVDLKCQKTLSPLRLQSMDWLPGPNVEKGNGYSFNLEMKMRCARGQESCLQIFQSTKQFLVVQNTCKCCKALY